MNKVITMHSHSRVEILHLYQTQHKGIQYFSQETISVGKVGKCTYEST